MLRLHKSKEHIPIVSSLLIGHRLVQGEALRNEGLRVIPYLQRTKGRTHGNSTLDHDCSHKQCMQLQSFLLAANWYETVHYFTTTRRTVLHSAHSTAFRM